MNQKINYQKILDRTLEDLAKTGQVPSLFLHSCCAPCSSYVLEYLSRFFFITVFYYNPNITSDREYGLRVEEQKRLIRSLETEHPISFLEGTYAPSCFYESVKGMEKEPEGGERCRVCYRIRLEETARMAKELGMDYFTTTLSISPLKNADWLNEIGAELEVKHQVSWLYSDFKKKGGYQRSIQLSREYDLYRQNYCGCIYSKVEQEKRQKEAVGEKGPDNAVSGTE